MRAFREKELFNAQGDTQEIKNARIILPDFVEADEMLGRYG